MTTKHLLRSKRVPAVATVALTAVALAGCGSSGSDAGSGGGDADTSAATAMVEKYMKPMTSPGDLPPLSTTPAPGKKVVVITNNSDAAVTLNKAAVDAAHVLGWTPIPIVYDAADPTGLTDAFAQAVADNPDGVITNSLEASDYAEAAGIFEERGIPVVTSNTTDKIAPPTIANIAPDSHLGLAGRVAAAWAVSNEGSDTSVAVFNVPSFPVLQTFEKDFKDEYNELCSGCHYETHAVQVSDLGSKVPTQVVSAVQANPSIKYVVMGFAGVSTGVSGALRAAGFADVKVIGVAASDATIAEVAAGTQDAWVCLPLGGMGWKSVDALARHFNGDDTSVSTSDMPVQLITQDNVPDPPKNPDIVDMESVFEELWLIG